MAVSPKRMARRRNVTSVVVELEKFRAGGSSEAFRNALAQIAMRLVDADDREDFRLADGATTLAHHLAHVVEEQALQSFQWSSSRMLAETWSSEEVHDCILFTVIALTHASLDNDMATILLQRDTVHYLIELVQHPPSPPNACIDYTLEAIRNLCFVDHEAFEALPESFIDTLWEMTLQPKGVECSVVSTEILSNIAIFESSRVNATPDRLASGLAILLSNSETVNEVEPSINERIAVADLLTNLCTNSVIALALVYELDRQRSKKATAARQSGAVFLAYLADDEKDEALKQSLEAFVHNVSWSDPAGKRAVQKIGISSFLHTFINDQTALDN